MGLVYLPTNLPWKSTIHVGIIIPLILQRLLHSWSSPSTEHFFCWIFSRLGEVSMISTWPCWFRQGLPWHQYWSCTKNLTDIKCRQKKAWWHRCYNDKTRVSVATLFACNVRWREGSLTRKELVEAKYAFVLHTINPFTKDTLKSGRFWISGCVILDMDVSKNSGFFPPNNPFE